MPDEGGCSWQLWQGWNDQVTLCLIIKLKFWEYRTHFDSKHLFFSYYYCLWCHPFTASTKNDLQMNFPLPPSAKRNNRYLLFKIMESENTCQILRTPLPTPTLLWRHKCTFPFSFFKVWSVTCLNANEMLNFMKIQSSYVLSSYQRNQAYISNYISYFLINFFVILCQ